MTIRETTPSGLCFSEFELEAEKTATYKDPDYLPLGLGEEVGELLQLFAQAKRKGEEVNVKELKTEMGDVLWVLSQIAREHGFWMDDAAWNNIIKLKMRAKEGVIHEKRGR